MNIRTLIHFLKWLVPALALLYLPLAYLLFFQNIRDLDDIKIQGRARIILSYDPSTILSIAEPPWASAMKRLNTSADIWELTWMLFWLKTSTSNFRP